MSSQETPVMGGHADGSFALTTRAFSLREYLTELPENPASRSLISQESTPNLVMLSHSRSTCIWRKPQGK